MQNLKAVERRRKSGKFEREPPNYRRDGVPQTAPIQAYGFEGEFYPRRDENVFVSKNKGFVA